MRAAPAGTAPEELATDDGGGGGGDGGVGGFARVPQQLLPIASSVVWTARVESVLVQLEKLGKLQSEAVAPSEPASLDAQMTGESSDEKREIWELLDALRSLEREATSRLSKLGSLLRSERATSRRRAILQHALLRDAAELEASSDVLAAAESAPTSAPLSTRSWEWVRRMRAYVSGAAEDVHCVVRLGMGELAYGFEYLGAPSRALLTPSSARCEVATFGALSCSVGRLLLGGAPEPLADTAATLGRVLGRDVLTLHCAPTLGGLALSRMLKAAVGVGGWTVLVAVCTLPSHLLNALSTAVHDAQRAIAANATTVRCERRALAPSAHTRMRARDATRPAHLDWNHVPMRPPLSQRTLMQDPPPSAHIQHVCTTY
jgi:hypothetical protein